MRNLISLVHTSLDGFTAGPEGELDWAIVDEELEQYVDDLLTTVDAAIYGRITYHMMESYWPTIPANPASRPHELNHSRWVENVSKIVFSRTLSAVEWNNTRLVKDHYAEEIIRLKHEPGGDMMIFGSPRLVHILTREGVIDEYRININPILLGGGIPLFNNTRNNMPLKLVEAKQGRSGVVMLNYQLIQG